MKYSAKEIRRNRWIAVTIILALAGAIVFEAWPVFPKSGYITVENFAHQGMVSWESTPNCRVTNDVYMETLDGPCSKEKIIESLYRNRDATHLPVTSSWAIGWLDEAAKRMSDLNRSEMIAAGGPTPTPKPIINEVALIMEANANEVQHARDMFSTLMDYWREEKQKICGFNDVEKYQGIGLKYPEALFVVADPAPYQPELYAFMKIVDLDSFNREEYPVILEAKVYISTVKGPDYESPTAPGVKVHSHGSVISGQIKISGPELEPAVFEGRTEPKWLNSIKCNPVCIGLEGGNSTYDFFYYLIDKGLGNQIDNAIRKTVTCQR